MGRAIIDLPKVGVRNITGGYLQKVVVHGAHDLFIEEHPCIGNGHCCKAIETGGDGLPNDDLCRTETISKTVPERGASEFDGRRARYVDYYKVEAYPQNAREGEGGIELLR